MLRPDNTPVVYLFGVGGVYWGLSFLGVLGVLFDMIEARWPRVAKMLRMIGSLIRILHVLNGHHVA